MAEKAVAGGWRPAGGERGEGKRERVWRSGRRSAMADLILHRVQSRGQARVPPWAAQVFFLLGGVQVNWNDPQLEEGVDGHGVLPNQQMKRLPQARKKEEAF